MRAARLLPAAVAVLLIVSLIHPASGQSNDAPNAPAASPSTSHSANHSSDASTSAANGASTGQPKPLQARQRPYEAPLLGDGQPLTLPPNPPEYLKHDAAGIRFAYHPSARDRVRKLIDECEALRASLSHELGMSVLGSIDVRVALDAADFVRVLPAGAPQGTPVVALGQSKVLLLRLGSLTTSTATTTLAAFRRGMAYLALDEVAGPRGLPRWFRMGYALHQSGEAHAARSRALWWASMQRRLIPLVDLDWHLRDSSVRDSVAAAEAADFVAFLVAPAQRSAFAQFVREIRKGQAYDQALRAAYQADPRELENAWRHELARHKAFLPILLGGAALWLLVALAIALYRRWRPRRSDTEQRPKAEVAKVHVVRVSDSDDSKLKRMPRTELPEPEVPKVSHDGRWHTLH